MGGVPGTQSVAEVVARYLSTQGVPRVYGLVGGHIQPLWDAVARAGINIVDVRHEGAAVYMAQAEADLSNRIGVAMVTAGPGLTNAVTAISNASVSRTPVLVISGRPPRPQAGRGAMQDIPQADIVRPIVRRVEQISVGQHVIDRLDAAVAAALGWDGSTGPAYVDFPVDVFDEKVYPMEMMSSASRPRTSPRMAPVKKDVAAAQRLIANSHRILLIAGRSAHFAKGALLSFLEISGALYLDTAESRGAIPWTHSAYVPAMRARAMQQADLIITVGRKLDYQLAYGSRAVFSPKASFLRIGCSFDETGENRRGDVEIRADSTLALDALTESKSVPHSPDREWLQEMRAQNRTRQEQLASKMANSPSGSDGRIHPHRLIAALNDCLDPDSIVVVDGGDILSFARAGLRGVRYLDCGALGCLGVGVPFATAAAINYPNRRVIALIGDGSFGFHGMELSTAARQQAKALFIVANNAAWNIDRHDQIERYAGHLVGVELLDHRYDAVAQGLGLYAESVDSPDDLEEAIQRGLENAPALLNVRITRDAVSPDFKNGLAAVPLHQPLRRWNELELARLASQKEGF